MTIGIYALYWDKEDLVYIGQSQNILNRFIEHKSTMHSQKHTNYKVQDAYNLYGQPKLIILEVCKIVELNDLEIYWTIEFDSINSGLNIVEPGLIGYGYNSSASKYSKLQLLLLFKELTRKNRTSSIRIAEKFNMEPSSVSLISFGKTHLWLKDKYPYLHKMMVIYAKVSKDSGSNRQLSTKVDRLPIVVSPDGIEFEISNIKQFAKLNNLQASHLGSVIRKERKTHKGWKLK